jgi:hypothetical protein
MFYSPKNASSNFEYVVAKNTNPGRFETVHFKNKPEGSGSGSNKGSMNFTLSVPQK